VNKWNKQKWKDKSYSPRLAVGPGIINYRYYVMKFYIRPLFCRLCEYSDEIFCYIKGGKLLYQSRDYYLLKKDSAPWS
jgi:hypothetical protein